MMRSLLHLPRARNNSYNGDSNSFAILVDTGDAQEEWDFSVGNDHIGGGTSRRIAVVTVTSRGIS